MNGFAAYAKKELLEQLRGYKLLILASLFILFGMTGPLFAKMMPEMLKNLSGSGITVTLPKAAAADAWAQFFKNVSQTGVIALILLFGTSLPQEVNRGTLIIPLSKGLARSAVILAKYAVSLLEWTAGYWMSAWICCGYTRYLFGSSAVARFGGALAGLWLFGAFLLAFVLLTGAVTTGNYGSLLLDVAGLGGLLLLNLFPGLQRWNPISLASRSVSALAQSAGSTDFSASAGVAAGLTILCLLASVWLFQKKNL